LAVWREQAINALAQPGEKRLTAAETKQDRRRIKALERELHRKEKALAEAAALSGQTRNWAPCGAVTLNPERDHVVSSAAKEMHTQQIAA
jgi:5-methylcytosine-specific restriction endonuclease McrA